MNKADQPPVVDISLWEFKKNASESADYATVREVAEKVKSAGGRAFLVGGCVRDALLGKQCHDFDVEVYGIEATRLTALLRTKWALDTVGAAFGVIKLHHHDVDIAMPRTENLIGAGHRDFSIATNPFLSVKEAAARRDFTINAILLDPLTNELVDPWNGIGDLNAGILRHVSDHFAEDPLRVLRAMQFLARFPFLKATKQTVRICASMSQSSLPRERLASEWEKLLTKGLKPSSGLSFLRSCGWTRFYPELSALIGCEQQVDYHPEGDVWNHTMLALDSSVNLRSDNAFDNLVVGLSVLCHDFGKPATTMRYNGRIIAHNHEVVGVEPARQFLERLWNREDLIDMVLTLVRAHMRPVPLVLNRASVRAYGRLSVRVGRLDLLANVVESDIRGTLAPEESLRIVNAFRERIRQLKIETESPKPIIQGRHLIELGLKPGPKFGVILQRLFDDQLAGKFSDLPTAMEYLQKSIRQD